MKMIKAGIVCLAMLVMAASIHAEPITQHTCDLISNSAYEAAKARDAGISFEEERREVTDKVTANPHYRAFFDDLTRPLWEHPDWTADAYAGAVYQTCVQHVGENRQ